MERGGHLPFLDINIYRRPDGSMGHKVCRKPSHINPYLNPESHHHSTYKPFFQPWCTEPGLCVTRKASMMSWSNSGPLSGKMGVAPNRYDRPSTRRLETPSRKTSPPRSLSSLHPDDLRPAQQNVGQTQYQMRWPAT